MIIKEDVDLIFEGIEVTDELKEAFTTKLEAVLSEKVSEIRKDLDEASKIILEAEKEVYTEQQEEQVDDYLNYAVAEWIKENKLALESSIKVEAAEKFISGMKSLLETYNINVDDSTNTMIKTADSKIDKLERELTDTIHENISLTKQIEELQKSKVLESVSTGLTESQKERLKELSSDVAFLSEDKYHNKLSVIKNSYFKNTAPTIISGSQIPAKMLGEKVDQNTFVSQLVDLL
jgi:exonuclease VII large subunit